MAVDPTLAFPHQHSLAEEITNAVSHGVGLLMSIAASVLLLLHSDSGHVLLGCSLFSLSLVFLYTMSTLYHAFPSGKTRAVFQYLDHVAIFILIAGSYSAYCMVAFYETFGIWMSCTVWAIALLGILVQLFGGSWAHHVSQVLYLVMGWLVISQFSTVYAVLSPASFWLLLAGGLAYTVGFVFYALQRFPWMHAVWHFFVLGGSVCHVLSVLWAM